MRIRKEEEMTGIKPFLNGCKEEEKEGLRKEKRRKGKCEKIEGKIRARKDGKKKRRRFRKNGRKNYFQSKSKMRRIK